MLPVPDVKYSVLFAGRHYSILLAESEYADDRMRKISIGHAFADSIDDTTGKAEELMLKSRGKNACRLLNLLFVLAFFSILLFMLININKDRKQFLDEIYLAYLKNMMIESSPADNEAYDAQDSAITVYADDYVYNAYYTGVNDIFIAPYIHGASIPEEFDVLDSYRNIVLFISVKDKPEKIASLFENQVDMDIGQEVLIISHPYGLMDTKTSAVINANNYDRYGHLYYMANIPLTEDLMGALVIDRNNRACGILLPVYRDFFSWKYRIGIIPVSFLKIIFDEWISKREENGYKPV